MSQQTDEIVNKNWDALLKVFHAIPDIKDSKEMRKQYESLKSLAKTRQLTPRQMDGIIDRCDYQISLIDNPNQIPFANMYKDKATFQLDKAQSNGKQ